MYNFYLFVHFQGVALVSVEGKSGAFQRFSRAGQQQKVIQQKTD